MRRSWLVWTVSVCAFFITAILVVFLGSSYGTAETRYVPDHNEADRYARLSQLSFDSAVTSSLSGDLAPVRAAQMTGEQVAGASSSQVIAQAVTGYEPQQEVYLADPSNYGERFTRDANGAPVDNEYIVVLHETVGSASSALNTFRTHHPRDEDQVSYHTLITLDGTVVYVVAPEQRAFGAGNSVFRTQNGEESVYTNAAFPSSVNNFAYHVSLETPYDGQNSNVTSHSGYTEAQYQSLAWLLSRTTVPNDRITTHREVDRSGSRMDPRSFEYQRLFSYLEQYPSRAGL